MPRLSKLPNGLSLVVAPVKGTKAATFLVLLPIGSRYEPAKISGASHFVEHLMFKGTTKRPTTLDISRELDAVGAQFNAFTDKDRTGYWVKIDAAHQEKALDILSDMIFHSKFEAAEVAKEKGVIIEEIRMYKDNPRSAAELLFDNLMFGAAHPLGRDIAGTEKIIKAVTRDELFGYYKSAYAPNNLVLAAAGNINKKTMALIREYFGAPKAAKTTLTKEKFARFFWSKKSKPMAARLAAEKRKVDQAHVFIGYPGLKITDPKRNVLAVLLNILGGNMSSRLFVEVREKRGLAYRVHADAVSYRDAGGVVINAGLNPSRLKEAIAVIVAQCARLAKQNVSAKELADAKSNLAGQLALSMEDSSAQASWFASKFWFEKNLASYEEEIRKLKKVTASQVLKLAKEIFKEKEMRLAVISPFDKKEVAKLL